MQQNECPAKLPFIGDYKRRAKSRIVLLSLVCGILVLSTGCLEMQTRRSEEITRPDIAYVSPNLDFNQIAGLGIFPIFPSEVENPTFGDAFSRSLTAELQARQSQWKIIPAVELVGQINQKNLGRGYKNLQADMNTFTGTQGFGTMTQETIKFLNDLNKITGTNSFLLGAYSINRQSRAERGPLGPYTITTTACKVKVLLYQLNKGIVWDATHTLQTQSNIESRAEPLAKVFAAYLGKGTLRQL